MRNKKVVYLLLLVLIVSSLNVTALASSTTPDTGDMDVNIIENDPNQPPNNTMNDERHIQEEQKRLEEMQNNNIQRVDPSELRDVLKQRNEDETSPLQKEVPSFDKDPIKEYQRVKIQKQKNLTLTELLKMVEHPEIIPSTPEEAGFNPEDDREFYHFTTKKGNKYYLIKDNLNNRETLTLVTEASEADLLSLLSDAQTTDEIIKQEQAEILEAKRQEEQKRLEEERQKYQEKQEQENEQDNKKEKRAIPFNLIKWGLVAIGGVLVVSGLRKILFSRPKVYEYDDEIDEDYKEEYEDEQVSFDETSRLNMEEDSIYEEEEDE